MPTVLITGANRGIGLEFVRQYAGDGWQVIAACRRPAAATELRQFAEESGGAVRVQALDVADPEAIRAVPDALGGAPLDLLVNNAGVSGGDSAALGHLDAAVWSRTLMVNTIAPVLLAETLRDNLARSERRTVLALTSRMGSIAENQGGGYYAYRSAKAGLNAAMKSLSIDLYRRRIIVVVVHPGWVKTDMGGPNAQIAPADSVRAMRRLVGGLSLADSGRFFNHDGTPVPW